MIGFPFATLGLAAFPAPRGNPPGPKAGPLIVHSLTDKIFWVEGGIGNCGFIIGEKGVIVVDATVSRDSGRELLERIAEKTKKPVTTVILTHGDLDHIGGLAAFQAGLTIIAQEQTAKKMEADAATGHPMVSPKHLPNRVVGKKKILYLEGVRLELRHWAPAHTAGDMAVFLPDERIVFAGDIFCMDQLRALVHLRQSGTSEGWVKSAKGVVALNAERFVVGHGQVQGKEALLKRVRESVEERIKIIELAAKGLPLKNIQAEVGDPPPGQSSKATGGPHFPPFSEVVYQELTGKNE